MSFKTEEEAIKKKEEIIKTEKKDVVVRKLNNESYDIYTNEYYYREPEDDTKGNGMKRFLKGMF